MHGDVWDGPARLRGSIHLLQDCGFSVEDLAGGLAMPVDRARDDIRRAARAIGCKELVDFEINWKLLWWQA